MASVKTASQGHVAHKAVSHRPIQTGEPALFLKFPVPFFTPGLLVTSHYRQMHLPPTAHPLTFGLLQNTSNVIGNLILKLT